MEHTDQREGIVPTRSRINCASRLVSLVCALLVSAPMVHIAAAQSEQVTLANSVFNTFGMGESVALDGDTAVLGAPLFARHGLQRGAAMVYIRSGGTWQLQQILEVDPEGLDDGFCLDAPAACSRGFGGLVAISGDTLIVGPYAASSTSSDPRHDAFVYTRTAGTWSLQATLHFDYIVTGVAIDGGTALVATADQAVHVYVRSGASWTQHARLVMPDGGTGDTRFASEQGLIAIDGDTIAIGAPASHLLSETRPGSIYVFVRSVTAWTMQAKLTHGTERFFVEKVALSGDTVLAASYRFERSGTTWSEATALPIPGGALYDGYLPAIDGNVAVLAHPSTGVFRFKRAGTSWLFLEKLSPNDPAFWLRSLAVSGERLLLGAPRVGERFFADGEFLENGPGAGYVFELDDSPSNLPTLTGAVNGFTVTLSWTPPGVVASSYIIEAGSSPGGSNLFNGNVGSARTISATVARGTYYIRVRGVNAAGMEAPSNEVALTVGPTCAVPSSPTVSGGVLGGTATVSWPAVPGATRYILTAGTTQGGTQHMAATNLGTATGASASGLPAGFSAWVRVWAENACGQLSPPRDYFVN